MNPSRRNFLRGAISGAAGTALAGGVLIGGAKGDADAATAATAADGQAAAASYPFHGARQAGILTPSPAAKQAFTCVAAFDCVAGGRTGLMDLLRALTSRARFLTAGGTPPDLGVGQPPPDSDVLGPSVPADGLTVTLSAGSSLFDDRYGLAARKPLRLTPMRSSRTTRSSPRGCTATCCCSCAPTTRTRSTTRSGTSPGTPAAAWRCAGRSRGTTRRRARPAPRGTCSASRTAPRTPAGAAATSLVWVDDPAEPARDSGAPLDGNAEYDTPDYKADPDGTVIPLDSHIRLANPRTPATANQRLIRRSYNYDLGQDANGNIQAGHVFIAYQQDIKRQFETIQERLVNEPLVDYVQPFGGGCFFALPGVRDGADWYGRGLLA